MGWHHLGRVQPLDGVPRMEQTRCTFPSIPKVGHVQDARLPVRPCFLSAPAPPPFADFTTSIHRYHTFSPSCHTWLTTMYLPQQEQPSPPLSSRSQSNSRPSRLGRSAPRSRHGCVTCKQRHVRCDEGRPSCSNCTRLQLDCQYRAKRGCQNRARRKEEPQIYIAPVAVAPAPVHDPSPIPDSDLGTTTSAPRPRSQSRISPSNQHPEVPPQRASNTFLDGQSAAAPADAMPAETSDVSLPTCWTHGSGTDGALHTAIDNSWNADVNTVMTPRRSAMLNSSTFDNNLLDAMACANRGEGFDGSHLKVGEWSLMAPLAQGALHIHQDHLVGGDHYHESHDQQMYLYDEMRDLWHEDHAIGSEQTPDLSPPALQAVGGDLAGSPPRMRQSEGMSIDGNPADDSSDHPRLVEAFAKIIHPPGGILLGGVRRWRRLQRHCTQLSKKDVAVRNALLCVGELFYSSMEIPSGLLQESEDAIRRRHATATNEIRRRLTAARDSISETGDALLTAVFLLAWFHVLKDRGLETSADLAFPAEDASTIITSQTPWNWYSKQILSWLNVLDSRATHLGGDFLLTPKALESVAHYPFQVIDEFYKSTKGDETTTSDESAVLSSHSGLSPAAASASSQTRQDAAFQAPSLTTRDIKQITLRFLLQPGIDFYLRAISFQRRITALDKHHRSRFTPDDELEVMLMAKSIEKGLWDLWAHRPSAISLSPGELAISVAPDVAITSAEVFSVHLATFWALFIYLHRVAWWHLKHAKTTVDALDETWKHLQASYGEMADGGMRRIIHPSVMWPVFMLGMESPDKERQTWAVAQLAALGDTRRCGGGEHDAHDGLPGFRGSKGATRNATRASLLLRAIIERKESSDKQVDELDLAREMFGRGFSLV
ncbi:hypothetical protein CC79DRAFT_1069335 [Sarocladium strictum]